MTFQGDYTAHFRAQLNRLRTENRYRHFVELERIVGRHPVALRHHNGAAQEVTVWCSNDYLGMGQHPDVIAAMTEVVKKGGFVEDKLGQFQLAAIREHGMAAHAQFAQFVLNDGVDRPIVAHLDGHDALSFRKFSFVKVEEPGGLPGAPAPGGA